MNSMDSPDDLPPVSQSNLPEFSSTEPAKKKDPPKEPAEEPLPKRIGSYRILAILGEGGMGRVYRAVQGNPETPGIALKVIAVRGKRARKGCGLFPEHEAKVLARLQHPGIAQIFEANIADAGQGPQPFFAMELIDGVTLTTFVEKKSLPAPGGPATVHANLPCDSARSSARHYSPRPQARQYPGGPGGAAEAD